MCATSRGVVDAGRQRPHHVASRVNPAKSPEPLRFKLSQAGSAVFLLAAILSFPDGVDPAFAVGAWCNFCISAYHHGLMTPRSTWSSWGFKFSCSDVDETRPCLRLLRVVDQAFVGYICLYTGCAGLGVPHWAVTVTCLLSALGGIQYIGLTICIALALTIPKLGSVPDVQVAQFTVAAIGGPVCFLYMYRIGAWCMPHRYFWHLCCGCLVSVAGVLNAHAR